MSRVPKIALLASARSTGTVVIHGLDMAVALSLTPATLVSGFQSPLERESLGILLRGSAKVIVCPARSALGMRLPAEWRVAMGCGRLTIRSFIDERVGKKCRQTTGTSTKASESPRSLPRRPTAELADQRNRFVCCISDVVLILHASPGGKLERLAYAWLKQGQDVFTLEDSANQPLIERGAIAVSPGHLGRILAVAAATASSPFRTNEGS